MTIYKYDGTINGIFSCIFKSFMSDETPLFISSDCVQTSFCDEIVNVATDGQKSNRVVKAFIRYAGKGALHDLYYAFRSGDRNKDTVIFNYVRKTLECRSDISQDFSCPAALDFYELINRIGNEIHLMKGFLRFSMTDNGVLYAHFSPDNDVADLLLPHFIARLGKEAFVIHDTKRNVVAMYNGAERKVVKLTVPLCVTLADGEENFTALWQTYYDSVTIKERLNERAMRGYMPARYHEFLSEKNKKTLIV